MPVSDVKNGRLRSFPQLWGAIWRGKAFGDQHCCTVVPKIPPSPNQHRVIRSRVAR